MSVATYLRAVAANGRRVIALQDFEVFAGAGDADYAIPRPGAEPDAASVQELIATMRRPRLEFLPADVPAAEPALRAAGFSVELRTPVMTLSAPVVVAVPDGLRLSEVLDRDGMAALVGVQTAAFGGAEDPMRVDRMVAEIGRATTVAATADGAIVGGGMAQPIIGGVTELVGIATAEPFRRRGIAGAVTAELARLVVARGATSVILTPGDADAQRIYARAGFVATDAMLHLVLG